MKLAATLALPALLGCEPEPVESWNPCPEGSFWTTEECLDTATGERVAGVKEVASIDLYSLVPEGIEIYRIEVESPLEEDRPRLRIYTWEGPR